MNNNLLNVLTREGVLINVSVRFWRGCKKLRAEDLGLQSDAVSARLISLGHKRLKHWIVLGGCKCCRAESLDMEGDCGADIRERSLVSVALADDRATRNAERISDVAIGVLFDDDFQLWYHV